ncbi:amino acid degradation protein [Virgibacillus profundi]|uniref:Amino acid degradation protein n=1 Tax=Virgibacillus profundi TaxID=2024555 RepID=A0A2A2IBA0_9BACI|nr:M20/M25/M40 family metallo-hydrolase [Virgibacillus profundi]PAV28400.1 amino acid degradation protein [Virgibacillus profundi]PXY52238.1 amino acid degradation protein [Virgibacillus profundi]
MSDLLWDKPESLRTLLCELVSWQSRSRTEGEINFANNLKAKLTELQYFKKNSNYVNLYEAGQGRKVVTALYKSRESVETIVLISHFDTVGTEEFGNLESLAYQPEELTKALLDHKIELPLDARVDLESGDYLFGRGTMDMKMGLALHMSLIEKASIEKWPINLLLVTVPDEEVDSAGMRAAIPKLAQMQVEHGLDYKLFLNSEPSFSQKPGDTKYYIYSGSIGKIMPAVLFYGKETHVGEPMSGLTANFMASFLTQQMEWNPFFREFDLGESTPLPVSLQQKDLKINYTTQTPYRVEALYNVFLMKRNATEIMNIFHQVATESANACNSAYMKICEREGIEPIGKVNVLHYEELEYYAKGRLGPEVVASLKDEVIANPSWDDREKSIRIADILMTNCQELGPTMILLFAPPYYPAVNASDNPAVIEAVDLVKKIGSEKFDLDVHQIHYFNGISDLSYVSYMDDKQEWDSYERNTPVWGETYSIPFADMQKLNAPVLNIGPFGKDAHKRTERLHMESAFHQVPVMLESLVRSMFSLKEIVE